MIKWWQKSKPKKIPRVSNKTPKTPMPNFQAIKISRRTTRLGYAGTITNLHIVLNTQKSLLKSSYPKNTCQHFLTQKNTEIKNFKPKKITQSSQSLEIQSTPPGHQSMQCIASNLRWPCLHNLCAFWVSQNVDLQFSAHCLSNTLICQWLLFPLVPFSAWL